MKYPDKIVISCFEKCIKCKDLNNLLELSPFIRGIAFMGTAIFDSEEFEDIILCCKAHRVGILFGRYKETKIENITAIMINENVRQLYVMEEEPQLKILYEMKQKYNADSHLEMFIFKETGSAVQNGINGKSYDFYNMVDDLKDMPCWKLLKEPMINYDGKFLGCWEQPYYPKPINVFEFGLAYALNHRNTQQMINLLKGRCKRINMNCPCSRCSFYTSLIWKNKTLDITQEDY